MNHSARGIAAALGPFAAALLIAPGSASAQLYERQKLHAQRTNQDWFGFSMSAHDERLAVGCPSGRSVQVLRQHNGWWRRDSEIVFNTADFGLSVALTDSVLAVGKWGRVWCFTEDGDDWVLENEFWDMPEAESFGESLTASSDFIVGGATDGTASGVALVLERDSNGWSVAAQLAPDESDGAAHHGKAVATDGDSVVVGADNGAYVYSSADWAESPLLLQPDDEFSGYWFASAVAVRDAVILIGSPYDDDLDTASGAVYVFRRIGDEWVQTQKLRAPDPARAARFGSTLTMRGTQALISAPGAEDNGQNSGKAYVWTDNGFDWELTDIVVPSDGSSNAHFGWGVALVADEPVVGAYGDNHFGDGVGALYWFSNSCTADWLPDNSIDTRDVLAFLGEWVLRREHCDLTRNGVVDTQDFIAFLNAWVAGC